VNLFMNKFRKQRFINYGAQGFTSHVGVLEVHRSLRKVLRQRLESSRVA
jgi:hypothetical protein